MKILVIIFSIPGIMALNSCNPKMSAKGMRMDEMGTMKTSKMN